MSLATTAKTIITTTGKNRSSVLVAITTTTIVVMMIIVSSFTIAPIVSAVQAQTNEGGTSAGNEGNSGSFKVIVNIEGIDSTIDKAIVWVTANGVTESKTLNDPVSLVKVNKNTGDDDEELDDAALTVKFEFKQGVIKVGDQIEACIKVLEHTDQEGNDFACEKGVNSSLNKPETVNISL
jgi:hypothetical protein